MANLEARIAALEAARKEDAIRTVAIQKEDWLNSEMKKYENNIKVLGLIYDIREVNKNNKSNQQFKVYCLQRSHVDTGICTEDELYRKSPRGQTTKHLLRGVLRDAHPVGTFSNGPVVLAFTESCFVGTMKEKLKKNEGKWGKVQLEQMYSIKF